MMKDLKVDGFSNVSFAKSDLFVLSNKNFCRSEDWLIEINTFHVPVCVCQSSVLWWGASNRLGIVQLLVSQPVISFWNISKLTVRKLLNKPKYVLTISAKKRLIFETDHFESKNDRKN